jgi:hypothetical protein
MRKRATVCNSWRMGSKLFGILSSVWLLVSPPPGVTCTGLVACVQFRTYCCTLSTHAISPSPYLYVELYVPHNPSISISSVSLCDTCTWYQVHDSLVRLGTLSSRLGAIPAKCIPNFTVFIHSVQPSKSNISTYGYFLYARYVCCTFLVSQSCQLFRY